MRTHKCKEESLNKILEILKDFGVTIPELDVPLRLESYRNMTWDERSGGAASLGITGCGTFRVGLSEPLPVYGYCNKFYAEPDIVIVGIRIDSLLKEITARRNKQHLKLWVWGSVLVLEVDKTK